MRSLADVPRLRVPRGAGRFLRGALIVAILLAIREARGTMNLVPSVRAAGGDGAVRAALREWSSAAAPPDAAIRFDSTPAAVTRDWAAALRGASTNVQWSSRIPAIGISVEPLADPKGANRIWLAAPSRSRIALSDSLGAMDTVSARNAGAAIGPAFTRGEVRATLGAGAASATRSDSLVVRPVLIIGRAGWEPKFIAAALEEYGWKVDARLSVAPGNDVTQGAPAVVIDTSRYAAVIVTDSSASRYSSAIEQYVRKGGGVILTGEGASIGALERLAPGTPLDAIGGEPGGAEPRKALALRPLSRLAADAVPLEKRGSRIAVAARRIGNGRVVQSGYVDTWRWRMAGAGDPVQAHRDWWSALVTSVAYAPRIPLGRGDASAAAPLAALTAALGPPSSLEPRADPAEGAALILKALFIVAVLSLVLETAVRRFDGRP